MNLKEEFPSKGKFYSSLTGKKFTDKEYEHVYNVWHKFEIKTMKDYHDSYLKCDVLSFADLFENFRKNSLNNYGLCLSNYLSAPGLSWDALLKTTKVRLELIPDPGMYLFFEKGTRGRISYVSNRYIEANNKYIKPYEPKQESKHITYSGANNLYNYAMSKLLPASGFKWIDLKEFDLNRYTSNSSKRCVLEVDLQYPKKYENYTMIIL